MDHFEKKSFLSPKNKGLVFGKHRLSDKESFRNLCLLAPTGAGKTTQFVIPNILKCKGSVVVTDPSGEIYKYTSGHMRDRGYKIQVLSPADLWHSLRFNPLTRFKTPQELKQIATIIGNFNSGSDPFWIVGAVNIIYILLSALTNCPDPDMAHLGNLRGLLNNFGVHGEGIKDFLLQNLDEKAFGEFVSFIAQDTKIISNILSSAKTAIDLWSDPDIVEFTGSNTVDIEALRDEKTIIYIIVPEHQVKYFSPVINLFYSACFEHCLKHTKGSDVYFFLDEFGNMGKFNSFETIATTLRKRRCSINIILQELSQLEAVYGKNEAKTIFSGGMGNKLFMGGLDLETCQYLEQVLGKKTGQAVVSDLEDKNRMLTAAQPLMSADSIRMMKETETVLISGRQKPAKLSV